MTYEQQVLPKLYITRSHKPPLASYHLWLGKPLTTAGIFTEYFRAILESNKFEVFNYLNPKDVIKSGVVYDNSILANHPYQTTAYNDIVLENNDVFIYLCGSQRGCPIWHAVALYESDVWDTLDSISLPAPKPYTGLKVDDTGDTESGKTFNLTKKSNGEYTVREIVTLDNSQ